MSHNRLSSLPSALFHQSPSLQKVFLQNNSLTLLAENQLQVTKITQPLISPNLGFGEKSSELLEFEEFERMFVGGGGGLEYDRGELDGWGGGGGLVGGG